MDIERSFANQKIRKRNKDGGEKDMFRSMRRKQKQITESETKQLLRTERRGVLAVNGEEGYPYAIPVNYIYDEAHGKIYFHGAKAGYKFDALKKSDKVCFTVYGNERLEEGDWAPYLQSAVIFGRCHLVEDTVQTDAHVREVARKYYPNEEEIQKEMEKSGKAVQLYELTIEHMSGKQIQEK